MGFGFPNAVPAIGRIPGEISGEYWFSILYSGTANVWVRLYSLAEKWINVMYFFLFSTIGPQSFNTSLESTRVFWMYQQGMLEFHSAQGSSGADEPREDPLHCCPLIGGKCCRDSFQHPAVAITFH